MPRPHRIFFPGAVYHITSRGNNKEKIFVDEQDYEYYCDLLSEAKELFNFKIYAYALMLNHIHLLLETSEPNLGKIMEYINYRYTIAFNKKYKRSGHLFGSRYYCKIVQREKYFFAVLKYIHLNPFKAGLSKNFNYPWSSYGDYISKPKESLADYESGLEILGDNMKSANDNFEELHNDSLDKKLWKKFESDRNCILGDAKFRQYIKKVAATF